MDEVIVNFGGELKALDNGHFGGYLVRFSDADSPDLAGDYFTKETDFGIKDGQVTPVYFHHRQPLKTRDGQSVVVKAKIGEATLSVDDEGVLVDAIIYNREQYEKAIVKAGKARKSDGRPYLGWSSGTATHLCDREKKGSANFIKFWQLGFDASVTPTPCEPQNDALPVKSYAAIEFAPVEELDALVTKPEPRGVKGLFNDKLTEQTPTSWQLESAFRDVLRDIAQAADSADITGVTVDVEVKVREASAEYLTALSSLAVAQINDYLAGDNREPFYLKTVFDELTSEDSGARAASKFSDHLEVVLAAAREVNQRAQSIQGLRVKAGRVLSEANRSRLSKLLESLRACSGDIETLLSDAEPKPKSAPDDEVMGLVAQFEDMKFRQLRSTTLRS